MATIPQIQANRLNAQKSTGPRSVEGKAASRFNAWKHGADACSRIIPGESEEDLLALVRDYYEEFQPQGVTETSLVDTLIQCQWEKHRIPRLEAAAIRASVAQQENQSSPELALGNALLQDASGSNVLQKLHRRSQTANRDWFRALKDLRDLQAQRPLPPVATPDPPEAPAPVRNEPNPAPQPVSLAPRPRPLAPDEINPRNPNHPPLEACPICSPKGRIDDNCRFWPKDWPPRHSHQ